MSEEYQVEPISVEEYLRLEETSEIRHEYVGGYLYAMTGASWRHNKIVNNFNTRIFDAADDQGCLVGITEVKLQVSERVIYSPDLLVSCDPEDRDAYIARHPCLVVEVLSPSTTRTDRREKFLAYLLIPTLRAYLIVHQDRHLVERNWRDNATDEWRTQLISGGVVPLPCPDVELTVEEIYRNLPPGADV
ncbi:MAG TPA: Uma2 family endonuclease [Thermomicrobiales bacterium]|nr:Uma2 family endonuclease [Thermomicrobiales bacterium]